VSGAIQIDDTYFNMAVLSSGVATMTTQYPGMTQGFYTTVSATSPDGSPLTLAIGAPSDSRIFVACFRVAVSGSTYTWTIIGAGNGISASGASFPFYVLGRPAAGSSGYGLRVRDGTGKITFDSGFKYARVLDVINTTYSAAAGGVSYPYGENTAIILGDCALDVLIINDGGGGGGGGQYLYNYQFIGYQAQGGNMNLARLGWGNSRASSGNTNFTYQPTGAIVVALASIQ
jgi:hypothetical protein